MGNIINFPIKKSRESYTPLPKHVKKYADKKIEKYAKSKKRTQKRNKCLLATSISLIAIGFLSSISGISFLGAFYFILWVFKFNGGKAKTYGDF